jgi:hypothetical protein
MGRSRLGAVFTAVASVALASPAGAAELTRVQSVEPGDPFAVQFSIRWDRDQERARISRETSRDATEAPPYGAIDDITQLRYSRVKNDLVSRIGIALYQDLELHVEIPRSLADDTTWRYGFLNGVPVSAGPDDTISTNASTPDGTDCAVAPCALFPVGSETTVYQGGRLGDVKAGVAWAVFNDRRDDTKPTWVLGLDVTFPTAQLYDPAQDRGTAWQSPNLVEGRRGAVGEKVWKYDLYTALSRRLGAVDPYFKAHFTAMLPSSDTYSNCLHAAELAYDPVTNPLGQMSSTAATNCNSWGEEANAKLPWIAGLTFGAELIPYEDLKEDQKVTFDVRLWADYTSRQRFYNELTDASGKLHMTDGHLTMGGLVGLYLRASSYVSLHAQASLATKTGHLLTGEDQGRSRSDVPATTADWNPNYDYRYDAPGNRFRISEVSVFALSVGGVLQF